MVEPLHEAQPKRGRNLAYGLVALFILMLIPCDVVVIRDNSVGIYLEREVAVDVPVVILDPPGSTFGSLSLVAHLRRTYTTCLLGIGPGGIMLMQF